MKKILKIYLVSETVLALVRNKVIAYIVILFFLSMLNIKKSIQVVHNLEKVVGNPE